METVPPDAIDSAEKLATCLASALAACGYEVDPIEEDWGWWIGVRVEAAAMAIGVYSAESETQGSNFAVTVFTEKSRRWLIWPFRSVSIVPQLRALKQDVAEVLEKAPDLNIGAVTAEFPL